MDDILCAFGLVGATATPLSGGLSGAVWQVDAVARRYILRRHDYSTGGLSHVASELAWLDALANRFGGRTPIPVPGPDGRLAPVLGPDPEGEGLVPWTMVSWVDGATLGRLPDPVEVALTGNLLAEMLRASRDWTPPIDFDRSAYDGAYFSDMARTLMVRTSEHLDDRMRQDVTDAVRAGTAVLDDVMRDPTEVGLIHADVHDGNVVFSNEPRQAGLIDFARLGIGCWALDLAMAMHYLTEELAERLLVAYGTAFQLSPVSLQSLPYLRLLAAIENLAILAAHPAEAAFVAADLPIVVEQARRLLP